ncbi:hypothetical protein [Trueperella pyogenes]|uniref:hypothetical protein n=1 Tax=Trueperella pyogenes TaxID=1661 RepID=UPI0006B24F96|nr:hypothetical protein [Trueperella pyogenes]ALD74579.1 hypothetical protein AN946_10045 [Trueperella pyogenes]
MTIADDRAALVAALTTVGTARKVRVIGHPPTKLAADLIYLTMTKVERAATYGRDLRITWQITATIAPTTSIADATSALDRLTGAIITAVHDAKAADLESVTEYVGLLEQANGATYPAAQLDFTSITPERKSQ